MDRHTHSRAPRDERNGRGRHAGRVVQVQLLQRCHVQHSSQARVPDEPAVAQEQARQGREVARCDGQARIRHLRGTRSACAALLLVAWRSSVLRRHSGCWRKQADPCPGPPATEARQAHLRVLQVELGERRPSISCGQQQAVHTALVAHHTQPREPAAAPAVVWLQGAGQHSVASGAAAMWRPCQHLAGRVGRPACHCQRVPHTPEGGGQGLLQGSALILQPVQ